MLARPPCTRYSKACATVAAGTVERAVSSASGAASPPKASSGMPASMQRRRSSSNGCSQALRPPSRRTSTAVTPARSGGSVSEDGLAAPQGLEPLGEPLEDRAHGEDLGVGVREEQDHRGLPVADERPEGLQVEVGLEEVGQPVPLRPARRRERDAGGDEALGAPGGHRLQEGGAKGVLLEQPVQAGAEHSPVAGPGPLDLGAVRIVQPDPPELAPDPVDATVVDLVARDPRPGCVAPALAGGLDRLELRVDVEPTQSLGWTATRLDPVEDPSSEHLVAATDTQHRGPGVPAGRDGSVESAYPEASRDRLTVALVPGRTTRSGSPRPPPSSTSRTWTPGSMARASRSVKLEMRGKAHHRDVQGIGDRTTARPRTGPGQGEGVLGVEGHVVHPREHAERRNAGPPLELGQPVPEQGRIPPELVDHEAADQVAVVVGQEGDRAVTGGEHPAPVDVADHHGRQPRGPGQREVDDVVVEEVDLGRDCRRLRQTTTS